MERRLEKLKAAIQNKAAYQSRKERLEQLEEQLKAEAAVVEEKRAIFEKEYKDFKAMNRLSFKSVWHKLKGDHERQLLKEEEEYLVAREVFELLETKYQEQLLELEQLRKSVHQLAASKYDYVHALRAVCKELIEQDAGKGRRLKQMNEKEAKIKESIEGLNDSYALGMELSGALRKLYRKVERAFELSASESRGDQYNYLARQKYEAIDDAKSYAKHHVEPKAREYQQRLGHLTNMFDLKILSIDSWTRELDFYWNVIGTGWTVHSEISRAMDKSLGAMKKMAELQASIDRMRDNLHAEIEGLHQQREELVFE